MISTHFDSIPMHSVFQLDHSLHAYVGVGVVVVVNGIAWDVEFSVGVVVVTVTGCDDVVTASVGTITQAAIPRTAC